MSRGDVCGRPNLNENKTKNGDELVAYNVYTGLHGARRNGKLTFSYNLHRMPNDNNWVCVYSQRQRKRSKQNSRFVSFVGNYLQMTVSLNCRPKQPHNSDKMKRKAKKTTRKKFVFST